MRRISAAAAIGIAALSLTACGGAPDDASEKDFCKAFTNVAESFSDFDDAKKATEELEEVGTPKSIDGDAREGFEIYVDVVTGADDEDEADEAGDDLDSDDEKKVEKFFEKAGEVCADA